MHIQNGIVALLLERGANVHELNFEGLDPAQVAQLEDQQDFVLKMNKVKLDIFHGRRLVDAQDWAKDRKYANDRLALFDVKLRSAARARAKKEEENAKALLAKSSVNVKGKGLAKAVVGQAADQWADDVGWDVGSADVNRSIESAEAGYQAATGGGFFDRFRCPMASPPQQKTMSVAVAV